MNRIAERTNISERHEYHRAPIAHNLSLLLSFLIYNPYFNRLIRCNCDFHNRFEAYLCSFSSNIFIFVSIRVYSCSFVVPFFNCFGNSLCLIIFFSADFVRRSSFFRSSSDGNSSGIIPRSPSIFRTLLLF